LAPSYCCCDRSAAAAAAAAAAALRADVRLASYDGTAAADEQLSGCHHNAAG
jgi:hypothetical protein